MEENLNFNELSLSESSKEHLQTIAKWVYVMSVIGLTIVIFVFIRLIYEYMMMSKWDDVSTGGGVGVAMIMILFPFFLIMCVVCFFPIYYLFRFSSCLKIAFQDDDSEALEDSFRYLKLHYMLVGIFVLCAMVFYLTVKFF